MSTVTINGNDYAVYADVAYATEYLAADFTRALIWAALDVEDQKKTLVTATRLLQRLLWIDGVPSTDDPVLTPVAQATSLLAADISIKPTLGDSGSTGSNVKAVGAGSAKVEFFRATAGTVLPSAAFDLLRGLLGPPAGADGVGLDGTAYGSEDWRRSRFDHTDYTLLGAYGVNEECW